MVDLPATSDVCFLICPLGEEGSETRRNADWLEKYLVAPAINQVGLQVLRADKIAAPGVITTQVISHLIRDRLVVADLTERNPNVYYELAVRHCVRKPYVQLISSGERLPFDIAGLRTVFFDLKNPELLEKAKNELSSTAQAALSLSSEEVTSPIALSFSFETLNRSTNPQDEQLAALALGIQELKTQVERQKTTASDTIRLETFIIREELDRLRQLVEVPDRLVPLSYLIQAFTNPKVIGSSRSFRTIVREAAELLTALKQSGLFEQKGSDALDLQRRADFVLHMINRELELVAEQTGGT